MEVIRLDFGMAFGYFQKSNPFTGQRVAITERLLKIL